MSRAMHDRAQHTAPSAMALPSTPVADIWVRHFTSNALMPRLAKWRYASSSLGSSAGMAVFLKNRSSENSAPKDKVVVLSGGLVAATARIYRSAHPSPLLARAGGGELPRSDRQRDRRLPEIFQHIGRP
jgi:hypothetical protein